METTLEELINEQPPKKANIFFYPEKELFVVFDGKKYQSEDYSREFFEKIAQAKKENDIEKLFWMIVQQKDGWSRINAIRFLTKIDSFSVVENNVYILPIQKELPVLLINEFCSIVVENNFNKEAVTENEDYLILKNFWAWVKNISLQHSENIFEDKFISSLLNDYKKKNICLK